MIRKLQDLTEEDMSTSSKLKTINKKTKSDFFRAFLNPRKIKKLLEEEKKGEIINSELRSDSCVRSESMGGRPRKTASMVVAHRKKLALGAQAEIKNERVRYNLWKMKKLLLEEGIISRYTYNLLIGKQVDSMHTESIERLESMHA